MRKYLHNSCKRHILDDGGLCSMFHDRGGPRTLKTTISIFGYIVCTVETNTVEKIIGQTSIRSEHKILPYDQQLQDRMRGSKSISDANQHPCTSGNLQDQSDSCNLHRF